MKFLKINILLLFIITPLIGQGPEEGMSLEKIVAVVGPHAIMKSEIDGQMVRFMQMDPMVRFNDPFKREEILNSLIDEKLILTKAEEDSVEATEQEVEQRWDQLMMTWVSQYGSEKRVEQILGKPIPSIKAEYLEQIRNQIITQKMTFTKFGQLSVTPREVEDFYAQYKDSLKYLPDQYELSHIVMNVKADNSSKDKAYKKAMSIRDSILQGTDFAILAENNSEDFGTASTGGDLGWIQKGRLFPEFEKAAFALQQGETSLPIETPFGYHIIQTIEKQEEKLNTRHILIKFGGTEDNRQATFDKLNEIRKEVLTGQKSFSEMAKEYSEDEATRGFGGYMGKTTAQELPPALLNVINEMEPGDITEPLLYNNDPAKPAYHIVLKMDFIPSHQMTLEYDRESVEAFAKARKQQQLLQNWIKDLREEIYWEIKD